MSPISFCISQKEPENYDEILENLARDIQKRQTRLSEIRLRERRASLLVTIYALAGWAVYVSMWYKGLLPQFTSSKADSGVEHAVKGAPVLIGPILCVMTDFTSLTELTRPSGYYLRDDSCSYGMRGLATLKVCGICMVFQVQR